jgi:hypothetical protein
MSDTYETPPHLPRDVAYAQLKEGDTRSRIEGLLSLSIYDPDWRSVQELCLQHLRDSDPDVVATAVLGLAHIARRQRDLDIDRVIPELERLRSNPKLAGRVEDALDDIRIFVPGPTQHPDESPGLGDWVRPG